MRFLERGMKLLDRVKLGKMVKIERVKRDLTQKELSKLAGVGQSTLWFIENGAPNANPRTIIKVLKALEIDIDIEEII